ncbi:MAG TPA: MBL fold metallo-hydrolase [Candidatus Hydrogenedens sp.]|nr:MBL fold metallo-hydrolase [Candidatus Hydrogenedens sp.]
MIIYHFCTSVNEANAYLLIEPESRESLLVDVPEWTENMGKVLVEQKVKLVGVFITHEHYDHTSGMNALLKSFPNLSRYPHQNFFNEPNNTKYNTIYVGKQKGHILSLPGHTSESVGLHIGNIVFTGDALFAGSVGGTISLHEAKQQVKAIKENILTLPENTIVLSGHGPATSVRIENKYNPFLHN